ncbi:zf-HC2 domain-containing protein [Kitasatospora sp. NPDC089509]|uniref:zf-HC2 domain-containing protein n=1 Tax=Kitasatospora sp. NPDC089509 TaxID=3364079 RepID=UPI0038091F76
MSGEAPDGSHVRLLLGAYLLGALTPQEDERVARHLPDCPTCTAEYFELSDMTALLAMVGEADLQDDPDPPPGRDG